MGRTTEPAGAAHYAAGPKADLLQIPVMEDRLGGASHASDLFHSFSTADLDAFADRMCGLFRPHDIIPGDRAPDRSLNVRPFELDHVEFGGDLMISRVAYNRKVRIEAPPLEQFFVFQVTLDGECRNTLGDDRMITGPGSICVLNLGRSIRQDMSPGYQQMAVRVTRSLLETTLEEELGYRVGEELEFSVGAQPIKGRLVTLARLMSSAWNDIQVSESGFVEPVVRTRFNRTVAALLLSAVPNNYSDLFTRSGAGAVPFFVRKAECYMRDHADGNLTISDIAAHVGVSVRTLQNGFRNFRGTTPMTFLKSLRLKAARTRLLDSCRTGQKVTDVALDCGFTHLSKFAQDYREYFGESPSETAKRGKPA